MSYWRFFAMIITSTVVMYGLTYTLLTPKPEGFVLK